MYSFPFSWEKGSIGLRLQIKGFWLDYVFKLIIIRFKCSVFSNFLAPNHSIQDQRVGKGDTETLLLARA